MGYCLTPEGMDGLLEEWAKKYTVYAPKLFPGSNTFSDTDIVRYAPVTKAAEIVFDKRSDYSYKEVLTPLSETLFYYTEEETKEPIPEEKGAIVFLRACDLNAVSRLDAIFLKQNGEDVYYAKRRANTKFVLMGCSEAFDGCFCVDMGASMSDAYDAAVNFDGARYHVDNKTAEWDPILKTVSEAEEDVTPDHAETTKTRVHVPENLDDRIAKSTVWDEYDKRCINCGRCTLVCPTCTCFTVQDIAYTDNGKAGERRRVNASCMIDGYTDVAGGGSYRRKNGQRMRFKVLHKVFHFKKRTGFHMCVGCGRCDAICPEYISYSDCVNRLGDAMKEVADNE